MPFHYHRTNLLTSDALDPYPRIRNTRWPPAELSQEMIVFMRFIVPALLERLGLPGDEKAFRALWAIAHLTGNGHRHSRTVVTHNIETADDIAVLQKGSRLLYGMRHQVLIIRMMDAWQPELSGPVPQWRCFQHLLFSCHFGHFLMKLDTGVASMATAHASPTIALSLDDSAPSFMISFLKDASGIDAFVSASANMIGLASFQSSFLPPI